MDGFTAIPEEGAGVGVRPRMDDDACFWKNETRVARKAGSYTSNEA